MSNDDRDEDHLGLALLLDSEANVNHPLEVLRYKV